MSHTFLGDKRIKAFFEEKGYKAPTKVQELAIPIFLTGRPLSVIGKTGSGKTLAFAIPTFMRLKAIEIERGRPELENSPRALILAPTRELAFQLVGVFKELAHHFKLKVRFLDKNFFKQKLEVFDIGIGVPGVCVEAIKQKKLLLDNLEIISLDEADQLVEESFFQEMVEFRKRVFEMKFDRVQIALFSATFPEEYVERIRKVFPSVTFQQEVVEGKNIITPTIETRNVFLKRTEKKEMLKLFLKKTAGKGVVFINKKEDVEEVHQWLKEDYDDDQLLVLHGKLNKNVRDKTVNWFRENQCLILTTDILARGIDIPDLEWVVNFDLPHEAVYYVHRCGRVGRNNKQGMVYNFVTPDDYELIKRINDAIRQQTALKLKTIKAIKHGDSSGAKTSKSDDRKLVKHVAKRTPRFARDNKKKKKK